MTKSKGYSVKKIRNTVASLLTVGGILWEERGLLKRIFKEADKQIKKIKDKEGE